MWQVQAGPLALVDPAAPGTVVSGRIRCAFREGYTHAGALLVEVVGPVTPAVAYVTPTTVVMGRPATLNYTLCTEVDLTGGPTLYWDDDAQGWSTDPAVVCASLVGDDVVDQTFRNVVDPTVCPKLAVLFPPDGDVYLAGELWYDCPPYL